jgi:hypothetical protein
MLYTCSVGGDANRQKMSVSIGASLTKNLKKKEGKEEKRCRYDCWPFLKDWKWRF